MSANKLLVTASEYFPSTRELALLTVALILRLVPAVSGVFVAIGLEPQNQMFANMIRLDPAGYIIAGEDCKTNLAGVYVAGDTRTKKVRQLVTAAADGAVAATEAAQYCATI